MEFLASPVWWALVAGASLVFAIWFRFGARKKSGNIHQIGRLGYFALITYAFMVHGWPGGVAICLVSGLIGQLLPVFVAPLWVKPVADAPTHTLSDIRPIEPLGRLAILRDIMENGISRGKVKALIQQGRLVAYEDPKDGTISLIRPEDLAVVQSLQNRDDDKQD